MIHELLLHGKGNAINGKELATLLSVDIRDITKTIEAERRAGYLICADSHDGYYLAENLEELEDYCRRLQNRALEMHKTRRLLLRNKGKLSEQ